MFLRWNHTEERKHPLRRRRGGLQTRSFGTVEILESRSLLSTFTWTNNVSGAFNVAANWTAADGTTHAVPGPSDSAQINFPGITVTVPSSITVASLVTHCTLDINSGATLTLTSATALSTIGGPLAVANGGELKVTGVFGTQLTGSVTTAGTFDVAPGATLLIDQPSPLSVSVNPGASFNDTGVYEVDTGTLTVNTPLSIANLTVTGGIQNGPSTLTVTHAFTWTGGDLDGTGTTTVASGATLSLNGGNAKILTSGHVLNNQGTGTWAGSGGFVGSGGSTFNNSGTLNAVSDTSFGNGNVLSFNNSGTFTKTSPTGTGSTVFMPAPP